MLKILTIPLNNQPIINTPPRWSLAFETFFTKSIISFWIYLRFLQFVHIRVLKRLAINITRNLLEFAHLHHIEICVQNLLFRFSPRFLSGFARETQKRLSPKKYSAGLRTFENSWTFQKIDRARLGTLIMLRTMPIYGNVVPIIEPFSITIKSWENRTADICAMQCGRSHACIECSKQMSWEYVMPRDSRWITNKAAIVTQDSQSQPMRVVRSFRNRFPCRGFVKISAIISPVAIYSTLISPVEIRSATKK